jgi:sugar phosphate isomerase/epimerase
MNPFQVFPSTTSHKHEPLIPTLDIFSRLGFCDLDLNLNHMIERGVAVDDVRRALNGQRVRIVSGGWCDFFDPQPKIEETFASVARQIAMAREFGVDRLRLFFGRLRREDYCAEARDAIVPNIQRLADAYPDMRLYFENHDGASSRPEVCREILERVARPNAQLNFDPINFEHAGVNCADALNEIHPFVAHVHVKGYANGTFCEFGEGDVDLTPVLRTLIARGYRGCFTVEYEGPFDRTVRLYQSVRRAESTIGDLLAPQG